MKNKLFLFLAVCFTAGQLMSQDTEENIGKLIDEWHLAASEADFDAYFGRMTEDAVFIGTDASENWPLNAFKEFSKPYFDRGKAWSFTATERHIYLNQEGNMAWFDELLDTWMGICRGSGVVELDGDQWKIAHYVLSATIPNDDMDQVIDLKKEKDSLTLIQLKKNQAAPVRH